MSNEFTKKDNINKKSAYIWGAMLGILSALVSMLVFSAVLLFLNIDRAYATPFATISIAIGGFIASRYSSKKIGDKGYLVGLIIGIVIFIVITALSIIVGNSLSLNTLFHFIIILLASIVGGITGVNQSNHKKYI